MPLNENAINDILSWAPEGLEASGDLMPLEEYKDLSARVRGFVSGIARRAVFNRVHRQSAHMAAGLAQFIANRYEPGVVDDADLDKVEEGLYAAILDIILENAPDIDISGLVPASRTIDTTAPLTGGGPLTDDLTLELVTASSDEAREGINAAKPITPATLKAAFTQNFAANGWQRLPSGLFFQWGNLKTGSETYYTVTFPIAFPTTCLQALVCGHGTSSNGAINGGPHVVDYAKESFRFYNEYTSLSGSTFMPAAIWFAIGC